MAWRRVSPLKPSLSRCGEIRLKVALRMINALGRAIRLRWPDMGDSVLQQVAGRTETATAPKLDGIHGLRFLAAAMVFVFHLRSVAGVTPSSQFDTHLGAGVNLFFIISAFSLMYSTNRYTHRTDWINVFAIKRFFRIAPLFYIMAVASVALGLFGVQPVSVTILSIFFFFNFLPDQTSSIVWAGWTIGVEMIFYALMPLFIGTVRSLKSSIVFLLIAIAIGFATVNAPVTSTLPSLFVFMAFPTQLQLFSGGICAYFIYLKMREGNLPSEQTLWLIFAPLIAAAALSISYHRVSYFPENTDIERLYVSSIVAFAALVVWQAWKPNAVFTNRFVVYWGERSYSLYLVHGPILILGRPLWREIALRLGGPWDYIVVGATSFAIVLAVSWFTYRFIEKPGMQLGAKLHG